MKRREFITLFAWAAVAWPLVARTQQPGGMRRIGVLMGTAESDTETQAFVAAFREGLEKLGWAEGRNIRIDTRWATPPNAPVPKLRAGTKNPELSRAPETVAVPSLSASAKRRSPRRGSQPRLLPGARSCLDGRRRERGRSSTWHASQI